MRVVLDTNVLVAGVLSATGPPGWIVEAVLAGDLELVLDAAIREEYEEVLHRPELGLSPDRVGDLLVAIDRFGWEIAAAPRWPVVLPDPDDEPFIAVAAASEGILITGNLRHFPARIRHGVEVRSPRQFVDELRSGV